MQNSIAHKVSLGIGIIVFAATVAMAVTYFVATAAVEAIEASRDLSQTVLTATTDMEVATVSNGLRVLQYLKTNDVYYRQAYQRHHDQFREQASRLLTLTSLSDVQTATHQVAKQHEALDQHSRKVMSNHERTKADIIAAYKQIRRWMPGAGASLREGSAPGSPHYEIEQKIEVILTELFAALTSVIGGDQSGDRIAVLVTDLRALRNAHEKLPPQRVVPKAYAEFDQTFEAFAETMALVLQSWDMQRTDLASLVDLQQQVGAAISTRMKPALKRLTTETTDKAHANMIRVLWVAGGMTLLLSLLAIFVGRYVRHRVVAPIQQLAAGADKIAGGDLNHRVTIATQDEYSDLAAHFNHMVDRLQHTMALHEEQETQLRALLDGIRDYAIFATDAEGYVTRWNQAGARIFGYETDDMKGATFARIFKDRRIARAVRNDGQAAIAAHGRYETDTKLMHMNGEEFDANIVVTPLSAAEDGTKGYSVVVRDITERLKAERRIEHLATKDALTGLSNRSLLMEEMASSIARASRSHTQLVVMFIDLDHFKAVNDALGHAAGDDLLRECAQRLTECVREGDIVARLGGDEFVVLLTDVTDTSIVSPIADRMIQLLVKPYHLHGQDAQTSASIGICFYPADGQDVTTLMKNADIAMYHAKELNRNNYQFYAEEMNQRMLQRVQLERELRSALENNEFVLHYQPQVNVVTGKIQGAESLVRWQHPTRGLLFPGDFIAVAEETGLIVPMGDWILNHACSTIKSWRTKGVGIPYIVVNVSAAQLNDGLVTSVRQALVKHDIAPSWLMLEITETMLMEQVEAVIGILRRIRELGIRIAMDDFGTGYSSLSVLQRLPLDTLKIDRSFVSTIDDETDNARAIAIVGAIIAIAKELNLSVVAEGVESPTQLAFLRTLHCDSYQGYLFSKPLDTMTLEARFAGPAKSVLHDAQGRAITMTSKITMELPTDAS